MSNFKIQNPQNFKLQKNFKPQISCLKFQVTIFQNLKFKISKSQGFKFQILSLQNLKWSKSKASKISNFPVSNSKLQKSNLFQSEKKSFSKKHQETIKVFLMKMKKVQIKKRQMKITHFKNAREQQNTHQLKTNFKIWVLQATTWFQGWEALDFLSQDQIHWSQAPT